VTGREHARATVRTPPNGRSGPLPAVAMPTLAQNPVGLFNLTDATAPFDYVVKK